jgi:hypothetical protein
LAGLKSLEDDAATRPQPIDGSLVKWQSEVRGHVGVKQAYNVVPIRVTLKFKCIRVVGSHFHTGFSGPALAGLDRYAAAVKGINGPPVPRRPNGISSFPLAWQQQPATGR